MARRSSAGSRDDMAGYIQRDLVMRELRRATDKDQVRHLARLWLRALGEDEAAAIHHFQAFTAVVTETTHLALDGWDTVDGQDTAPLLANELMALAALAQDGKLHSCFEKGIPEIVTGVLLPILRPPPISTSPDNTTGPGVVRRSSTPLSADTTPATPGSSVSSVSECVWPNDGFGVDSMAPARCAAAEMFEVLFEAFDQKMAPFDEDMLLEAVAAMRLQNTTTIANGFREDIVNKARALVQCVRCLALVRPFRIAARGAELFAETCTMLRTRTSDADATDLVELGGLLLRLCQSAPLRPRMLAIPPLPHPAVIVDGACLTSSGPGGGDDDDDDGLGAWRSEEGQWTLLPNTEDQVRSFVQACLSIYNATPAVVTSVGPATAVACGGSRTYFSEATHNDLVLSVMEEVLKSIEEAPAESKAELKHLARLLQWLTQILSLSSPAAREPFLRRAYDALDGVAKKLKEMKMPRGIKRAAKRVRMACLPCAAVLIHCFGSEIASFTNDFLNGLAVRLTDPLILGDLVMVLKGTNISLLTSTVLPKIMPSLFVSLDGAKRGMAVDIVRTLGVVAWHCGDAFQPFLEESMVILFSLMQQQLFTLGGVCLEAILRIWFTLKKSELIGERMEEILTFVMNVLREEYPPSTETNMEEEDMVPRLTFAAMEFLNQFISDMTLLEHARNRSCSLLHPLCLHLIRHVKTPVVFDDDIVTRSAEARLLAHLLTKAGFEEYAPVKASIFALSHCLQDAHECADNERQQACHDALIDLFSHYDVKLGARDRRRLVLSKALREDQEVAQCLVEIRRCLRDVSDERTPRLHSTAAALLVLLGHVSASSSVVAM